MLWTHAFALLAALAGDSPVVASTPLPPITREQILPPGVPSLPVVPDRSCLAAAPAQPLPDPTLRKLPGRAPGSEMSSVVSPHVTQTRKQIDRSFDRANDQGSVLIIDEADALLGATDSHDRDTGTGESCEKK